MHGHAGVHVARAVPRRRRRSITAPTSTRSAACCSRCSTGRPPFDLRGRRRADLGAPARAATAAERVRVGAAARRRRARAALPREGARRAVPVDGRAPRACEAQLARITGAGAPTIALAKLPSVIAVRADADDDAAARRAETARVERSRGSGLWFALAAIAHRARRRGVRAGCRQGATVPRQLRLRSIRRRRLAIRCPRRAQPDAEARRAPDPPSRSRRRRRPTPPAPDAATAQPALPVTIRATPAHRRSAHETRTKPATGDLYDDR